MSFRSSKQTDKLQRTSIAPILAEIGAHETRKYNCACKEFSRMVFSTQQLLGSFAEGVASCENVPKFPSF